MSVSRRLIRDESGVAVALAVSVLAVVLLLVAVVLSASIQANNTASRDTSAKRALGAAEAGMQIARYRLNKVDPAAGMCLTDQPVATGTSGAAPGECPPATAGAGNGATYSYYVTPVLDAGTACGGTTAQSGGATPIQRCITSIGTVGNVVRRLEALVASAAASTPLFPRLGLSGLGSIDINQNGFGDIVGRVATNGEFKLKSCKTSGSASSIDFAPGPSGTISNSCSGTPNVAPPNPTPWPTPSFDGLIGNPNTALAANNDNAAVFGSAAGFDYNPASGTRSLEDSGDATLTLTGQNPRAGSGGYWIFNFCEVKFSNKTSIVLLNGAKVQLFIDSSSRPGSSCSSDSKFTITNTSYLNYNPALSPPADPTALQIIYYGAAQINVSNQSGFGAALFAPNAPVKFTNKTNWYGAIYAQSVTATNGLNFVEGDVSGISSNPPGSGGSGSASGFTRSTWEECPSAPTNASDPQSGC